MSVYNEYSKYYDLLYKDKDYKSEVDYIDNLIKKNSKNKVATLLDIGCGTGTHASFFVDKGYKISGIDLSSEMITAAKEKKITGADFRVADAVKFDLGEKFDTILKLFHVIGYHLTDADLENSFKSVAKHLKPGGLFIFDIWYGPCVLSELPKLRVKELEDVESQIIRLAIPDIYPNENRVDVNYQIVELDKKTRKHKTIKESHKVRYFFKPEIERFLESNNFEILVCEEWVTGKNPDLNTFSVCFVGRLKK